MANLRMVLLPAPAMPKIALVSPRLSWKEIPFRTELLSNAMETSSKTITGDCLCSVVRSGLSTAVGGAAMIQRYPKTDNISRVAKKSTAIIRTRSEEHTSELQSRGHLVC